MTRRPKVSRDIASIFTEAQAWAIESMELDDRDGLHAEALLAALGITLVEPNAESCSDCGLPFNDADAPPSGMCAACAADDYDAGRAEDEHIRRQEIADWENSRGSR